MEFFFQENLTKDLTIPTLMIVRPTRTMLIRKSSRYFLIFGLALAVIFVAHYIATDWPPSSPSAFVVVYSAILQAADPNAIEYDDTDAVPALTLPSSIHVALWRDFDAIQSHRKLVSLPKPKEETIHDILAGWKDTQFDAGYGSPLCACLHFARISLVESYCRNPRVSQPSHGRIDIYHGAGAFFRKTAANAIALPL